MPLRLRHCCLVDQAWHKRSKTSADVLLNLDRHYLGGIHLLVEELDDPLKRRWDLIRDEDEPDAASLEIRGGLFPELLGISSAAEVRAEFGLRVQPFAFAPARE